MLARVGPVPAGTAPASVRGRAPPALILVTAFWRPASARAPIFPSVTGAERPRARRSIAPEADYSMRTSKWALLAYIAIILFGVLTAVNYPDAIAA